MGWQKEVLDLIADMKREADKSRRAHLDHLAADIISQDCQPLVMADNLSHWLKLADRIAA